MATNSLRNLALVAAVAAAGLMWTGCCGPAKRESSVDKGPTGIDGLRAHFQQLEAKPEHQDSTVEVQHILIGFRRDDGSETVPGKGILRSPAEAEALTAELFDRIRAGTDFGSLVTEYTDDSPPGIYGMYLNDSVSTLSPGYYPRTGMVRAFGDVGWRLQVGEVGVAKFDPATSPYGYHIIKRLK